MKNSPLTTILLGILLASALFSVGCCWLYIHRSRELRSLQSIVGGIQNNQRLVQMLAGEAVEYGKKNPSIEPLLEASGLKPKSASTNTNKPPMK